MITKSNYSTLITAIIISAIIISGAIVFFALKMDNREVSDAKIESSLNRIMENRQQDKMRQHHLDMNKEVRSTKQRLQAVNQVDKEIDHIFGNSDAEFTLIEYGSFGCVHCADMEQNIRLLVAESKENLNWVYRHLPVAFRNSREALLEAEASECVSVLKGESGFWKFADVLNKNGHQSAFSQQQLRSFAKETGVNESKFEKCLSKGQQKERINRDTQSIASLDIGGLPVVVLKQNKTGKTYPLIEGISTSYFKFEIDQIIRNERTPILEQITSGSKLFATNCAGCHGDNADGKLNKAPALNGTAHAWHHSNFGLFQTIKEGSTAKDSPMKGWKDKLTDDEIESIIRYFQSLWNPEMMR